MPLPLRRLLLAMALNAATACAPEPALPPPARPLSESIEWAAVPGATGYAVRAWSGPRLLFEAETTQSSLSLDASMRRACAQFDTVQVRIYPRGVRVDSIILQLRP